VSDNVVRNGHGETARTLKFIEPRLRSISTGLYKTEQAQQNLADAKPNPGRVFKRFWSARAELEKKVLGEEYS